jgi:hypothetical protein
LLTIDFENNKMLQLEIDAIAAGINEEALNTFCNTCLQR